MCIQRDCLYRGNAGSGARFAGLYDPWVENGESDFNKASGFVAGMSTGLMLLDPASVGAIRKTWGTESFFLGYAAGVTIDTLNCAGEPIRISNPALTGNVI